MTVYNNGVNTAHPNVAAHAVVISEALGAEVGVVLNTGQTLMGVTGADPIATTLTALQWVDVSGTTQAAAVNSGYVISNAAQTTVTLPATAAEGSVIAIAGKGAGGWIMQANGGQTIKIGNQTTSTAGALTSSNQWDCVEVVCVTANTTWVVRNMVGNIAYS
jgi:hypothetical protein